MPESLSDFLLNLVLVLLSRTLSVGFDVPRLQCLNT
jgi:hypothetical protein